MTMKAQMNDNIIAQDLKRRQRVTQRIILFFMAMIASLYFASLNIPNPLTHLIILAVEILCCGALWSSHTGHSFIAGILVVSICEAGLMSVILTTRPFNSTNLPLLDLFVMAISLTVSLLPARWSFYVALFNSLFIFLVLRYQLHTRALDDFLATHFYNGFIRPTALQWIVVGISYIWVQSTNKYIAKIFDLQVEILLLKQNIEKEKQNTAPVIETQLQDVQEAE